MGKLKIQALILVLAFMSCTLAKAQAQTQTLTYSVDGGAESEKNFETGKLQEALGDDFKNVTSLTIVGALNVNDVKALRLMAGGDEYDISKNTTYAQVADVIKEKLTEKNITSETEFNNYLKSAFGKLQTLDLSKASFLALDNTEDTNVNVFLTTTKQDNLVDNTVVTKDGKESITSRSLSVTTGVQLPEFIFSNCDNLKTVTLNAASTISGYAFRNCDELKECTNLIGSNEDITVIGASAFAYCKNFDIVSTTNTNGELPKNLIQIGNGAFSHCSQGDPVTSGISAVMIPASVTVVDMGAFDTCLNLKKLTFDGSLEDTAPTAKELNIANRAFADCKSMVIQNDGKLPNRIVNILDLAFASNSTPKISLPVNSTLTGQLHEGTFNGETVKEIGGINYGAFGWCGKMTELDVPANITHIQNTVFQDCQELTTINFTAPENIVSIGGHAFHNDGKLKDQFNKLTNVTTIGEAAFQDCKSLTNEDANSLLSKVTRIENFTYQGCTSLTDITINKGVNYIGDLAFAGDANMQKITVSSEKIEAYDQKYEEEITRNDKGEEIKREWKYMDKNPFQGMNPNHVQLVFEGDAATNYTNYRNDIQSTNEVGDPKQIERKGNAFMFLLTKTLESTNSTDKKYDVAPQLHADVKLVRTFKEGWNTLVLPFEITRQKDQGTEGADSGNGTGILKEALNTTNDKKFVVSVYRGLKENGNEEPCFMFLKYSDVWAGIYSFEPLLIRMTKADIEAAENNTYTFTDVDVNMRHTSSSNTVYTAEQMQDIMGKNFNGKNNDDEHPDYFTGNHKDGGAFNNVCTYDKYYFTGTLTTQTITLKDDTYDKNAFLNDGDYIIQSNTFVRCTKGKGYGVKAFYGYFKRFHDEGSEDQAAKNIGIGYVDDNGEITAIDEIDGVPVHTTNARIYNLNGQMVGTDTSTLSKGIYIMNGRKFIVK